MEQKKLNNYIRRRILAKMPYLFLRVLIKNKALSKFMDETVESYNNTFYLVESRLRNYKNCYPKIRPWSCFYYRDSKDGLKYWMKIYDEFIYLVSLENLKSLKKKKR